MTTDDRRPVVVPLAQRQLWPGTRGPSAGTPARRPGSIRRTTTIDVVFGPDDRDQVLVGRGRDLRTFPDGTSSTLDEARLEVRMDVPTRTINAATAEPGPPLDLLVGASATTGLRRLLRTELPELVEGGSALALLLDDVPVATLISAGSLFRRDTMPPDRTWVTGKVGVCAGWAPGGVMALAAEQGTRRVGEGPLVPSVEAPEDELAWHHLPPLPPGSIRRHRRIDVHRAEADGDVVLDVFFRDAYIEPDGLPSGIHEYAIAAVTDPAGIVTEIEVRPGILPSPDCPGAAASAQTVLGLELGALRRHVDEAMHGTSTCTHLNDALRSLTDVTRILRHLEFSP